MMNHMNIQEFKASIAKKEMPLGLAPHLQALWHDGLDNWSAAHDLIDQLSDKQSAHVHAYLHHKEGDIWNADYWYSRAGKKRPSVSLDQEWEDLVAFYLQG